jgi:hypothetical protein
MTMYTVGRAPRLIPAGNAGLWPGIARVLPADLDTLTAAALEQQGAIEATTWMPPAVIARNHINFLIRKGWLVEASGS